MKIEDLIDRLQKLALEFPGAEVMSVSDARGDECPKPIKCADYAKVTKHDTEKRWHCEGREGEKYVALFLDD